MNSFSLSTSVENPRIIWYLRQKRDCWWSTNEPIEIHRIFITWWLHLLQKNYRRHGPFDCKHSLLLGQKEPRLARRKWRPRYNTITHHGGQHENTSLSLSRFLNVYNAYQVNQVTGVRQLKSVLFPSSQKRKASSLCEQYTVTQFAIDLVVSVCIGFMCVGTVVDCRTPLAKCPRSRQQQVGILFACSLEIRWTSILAARHIDTCVRVGLDIGACLCRAFNHCMTDMWMRLLWT